MLKSFCKEFVKGYGKNAYAYALNTDVSGRFFGHFFKSSQIFNKILI